MAESSNYDVVVIGAGVFGAWTAWHLAQRKKKVLVLDAYGAAHSRASSGGETRIIRMSYATDEIYTRWSQRSLVQWKELSAATGQQLFQPDRRALDGGRRHWPVARFAGSIGALRHRSRSDGECRAHKAISAGKFRWCDPRPCWSRSSGVLMARRGVQTVIEESKKHAVDFQFGQAETPESQRSAGRHRHLQQEK